MARKRNTTNRRQRDTLRYRYPGTRMLIVKTPLTVSTSLRRSPLPLIEDRRTFHPLGALRSAAATVKSARRIVTRDPVASFFGKQTKARLHFADPSRVVVCVRRKIRKEILHALGKAGKGHKRPKRGPFSDISC